MSFSFRKTLSSIDRMLSSIPEWFISLAMRLVIFKVFWFAVQTKVQGWTIAGQHFKFFGITDNTFLLFDFEYGIPLLDSTIAAYAGTFGEFFLSLLIILGLFTRFAALGLLIITVIIQFFVYPDAWWTVHVYWALPLLYLIKFGGGKLSLDYLICKK